MTYFVKSAGTCEKIKIPVKMSDFELSRFLYFDVYYYSVSKKNGKILAYFCFPLLSFFSPFLHDKNPFKKKEKH